LTSMLAAALVYAAGMTGTDAVNRAWSFESKRRHGIAVPRYLVVHASGAAVQMSIQFLFHRVLGMSPLLVQAGGMVVVALLVFVLLEFAVFREDSGRSS